MDLADAILILARTTSREECLAKGIKGLVVITAGYSETGAEGLALERELRAKIREAGARMIGPNCMGVINTDPEVRLDATFSPTPARRGSIGFVSQSGALGVAILNAAADLATEHARNGSGPIILEMVTYRYRGHSMSDPAKYRPKEEVQKMRSEHDPIEQVKDRLMEKKWAKEEDLKAIDKEVRQIVSDSAEFAQTNPEPDPEELWTDIYLETAQAAE